MAHPHWVSTDITQDSWGAVCQEVSRNAGASFCLWLQFLSDDSELTVWRLAVRLIGEVSLPLRHPLQFGLQSLISHNKVRVFPYLGLISNRALGQPFFPDWPLGKSGCGISK